MKKVYSLGFFMVLLSSLPLAAQTTNYKVYSLFVLNIARYSSWPEGQSKDFKIAVLGKSKIYEELVKNAEGKAINDSKIVVSQVESASEAMDAQIIFVSDGKSSSLAELKQSTEDKSVMIIAEREGLFKKGAAMSFIILDNNSLRFDLNSKELEKRKIKISKNLKDVANTTI